MKKQQKHYTPEEKVAILWGHLLEGVTILSRAIGYITPKDMLAGYQ